MSATASTQFIPLVIGVLLTIIAVAVTTGVSSVRDVVDAIPLRALVGIHAVRFIGVVFLALTAQGELSARFGRNAGWGDIFVASAAVALAVAGLGRYGTRRWIFVSWNALGMLDLLAAVVTAALVIARGENPGMEPLLRLPLLFVPVAAIPLLMAGHVAVFRRLLSPGAGAP